MWICFLQRQNQSPKQRPASTLGFRYQLPSAPEHALNGSHSHEDLLEEGAPKPPDWLIEWDGNRDNETDNMYVNYKKNI